MQITMEALERALAPIEEIGQGELDVEVGKLRVVLRMLTPEQENDVQKYAEQQGLSEEERNLSGMSEYLERFRLAILSYSIVAVGDQDLRQVKAVETGEFLEGGIPIKIPKHLALRQLMLKWTGSLRSALFQKYGDLITQIERKAEAAIQFDPTDLDDEIKRLEARLEMLRKDRDRKTKIESSAVNNMVKAATKMDKHDQETFRDHVDQMAVSRAGARVEETPEAPPVVETPPEAPQPAPVRRSILPTSAPPPGGVRAPVAPQQPVPPPTPVVQQPAAPQPPPQAPQEDDDSFVDFSDGDAMETAMQLESQRLAAMRRHALTQGRMTRPPHLDALAAAGLTPEDVDPSQLMTPRPTPTAPIDGVETFSLPVEELQRPKNTPPGARVPLNQGTTSPRSVNPRFQKR